ncbi:hypothetical protein EAF04_004977 [Stromatinia cepivora]|nr:hypothetical protein EAF04_004977 [Stromatinia cepivora]
MGNDTIRNFPTENIDSDSMNKAFGYVYEMKLPKDLVMQEKNRNAATDKEGRKYLIRFFISDTAMEFDIPRSMVTLETIKFRGLPYLTSEIIGEDELVKGASGRRRNSEPLKVTREATSAGKRVRRNSWTSMTELEATRPSILEKRKKIRHREPLRDPIDPAGLGNRFRRKTWSPMSRSEAARPSNVEKRSKIKRRCSGVWAPLPTWKFTGEVATAMKENVESAPISSLALLGEAKVAVRDIRDIVEGGQSSSTNEIGGADRT